MLSTRENMGSPLVPWEAPPFQSNDCRFDPPYDQPKVVKKCVTHKSQLYHPRIPVL